MHEKKPPTDVDGLVQKKRAVMALFSLFDDVVQTIVDACAEVAQLVDDRAVATLDISASSDKSPEQSNVIPRQDEHKWECHKVTQSPPHTCKYPQQDSWRYHTQRYRYEDADSYM